MSLGRRAVGPGAFALAAAALRGIAFLKCAGIADEDLSINDEDERESVNTV